MDACVELASRSYPKEAIHLEFFSADEEALTRPQEAFKVRLAGRGIEIDVPSGVSIIDALARHGVQVDMLCQQGVCGTCLTDVLGGIPDHRDSFLTDSEKHANDKMMICCSRARSPVLILDL
jgi:vanillate O-demethylase ferredoxin subunit